MTIATRPPGIASDTRRYPLPPTFSARRGAIVFQIPRTLTAVRHIWPSSSMVRTPPTTCALAYAIASPKYGKGARSAVTATSPGGRRGRRASCAKLQLLAGGSQPLERDGVVLWVSLPADETASESDRGHAGCSAAGEGVEDQVAGVREVANQLL